MKKFTWAFMILLTVSLSRRAQWTTDVTANTQVSPEKAVNNMALPTSDGKTYIVYWEIRQDSSVLKVQMLDADGNKLFGEQGKEVNTTAAVGTVVQISDAKVDRNNNLIVAFYGTDDGFAYANKISPSGENVWGDGGIVLSNAANLPRILPTESGVVISYLKAGKANVMKYNEQTGEKMWSEPIVVGAPESGYPVTFIGEMDEFSDGSFVAAIYARKTAFTIGAAVYAQKFSKDGASLWSNPVRLSQSDYVTYNRRYDHFMSGDVFYFAYNAPLVLSDKAGGFLQKVDANGNLPWGINGKDFLATSYDEINLSVKKEGAFAWVMDHLRTISNVEEFYALYLQKINLITGESVFGAAGKEIYPLKSVNEENQKDASSGIIILNGKPIFVGTNTFFEGVVNVLSFVQLDDLGNIVSETPMSPNSEKGFINLVKSGNQPVAVWGDYREGEFTPHIYAQNLDPATLSTVQVASTVALKVFPNPFTSVVTVQADAEIVYCDVFDFSGKHVARKFGNVLPLSELTAGSYLLKITFKSGKTVTKTIIKSNFPEI